MARNSARSSSQVPAAVKKASTRNSALCTGLRDVITSVPDTSRSEEHTSELQSRPHLVCRLLLEKKKKKQAKAGRQIINAFETEMADIIVFDILVNMQDIRIKCREEHHIRYVPTRYVHF